MRIAIENAIPGMVLADNIYRNENDRIPLVNGGTVLSEKLIESLIRNGFDSIKIRTKPSDVEETVNEEVQEFARKSIKDFEANNKANSIENVIENSQEIVNKILNSRMLSYDLSKYTIGSPDAYQRIINTCCFAVALGKEYNKLPGIPTNKLNLNSLAVACLLHSIGKLCEDPKLLRSVKFVNNLKNVHFPGYREEFFESYDEKNIPVYSYAMLVNNSSISSTIRTSILLCGENEIGEGPLKATPKFLSNSSNPSIIMSKIIRVCNEYEKALEEVISDKEKNPSYVIDQMVSKADNGNIDKNLTALLLRKVPLYSEGLRVQLSVGVEAVVVRPNPRCFDRPVVKVGNTYIDLEKISNVRITKICDYDLGQNVIEDELKKAR